jgi:hypothetical protein
VHYGIFQSQKVCKECLPNTDHSLQRESNSSSTSPKMAKELMWQGKKFLACLVTAIIWLLEIAQIAGPQTPLYQLLSN